MCIRDRLNTLTVDYISSQLGNKLDVIKSARIYIKAPNQPEKLIATVDNNTNPNSITFTSTDAEMLEYFRTNENSLIIDAVSYTHLDVYKRQLLLRLG